MASYPNIIKLMEIMLLAFCNNRRGFFEKINFYGFFHVLTTKPDKTSSTKI
jgi:hypothetical protein